MREFQQKRKNFRLIYSKLSLIALLIVLIFAMRGVWQVYGKEKASATLKAESLGALQSLQEQQADLTTENGELSTPQGVERQIRLDYHMVKPGEQLAVIVSEATSGDASTDSAVSVASTGVPSATATSATTTVASGGFWQAVKDFFGGN